MQQNVYQKLGKLIERNSSIKWLGPNSLLGDRDSNFYGLRIFAKYVSEKKRKDPSSLTAPHGNNLLCIEFIDYLSSKAKESTNEREKKQYEKMAEKASNMLRPGADGQMNDEIFVEYANIFHELGIGDKSEEVMSKFFDALDKIKTLAPHLTKTIEGITSPKISQGEKGALGQQEEGREKQHTEAETGAQGAQVQGKISLEDETEDNLKLNLSEERQRQILQKKEEEAEKEHELASENPGEEKSEELEPPEVNEAPAEGLLIPSEGEEKLDQKELKTPEEDEKEQLPPKKEEENPENPIEDPGQDEATKEQPAKEEIPQKRVQRTQMQESVPNLSETHLAEQYYSESAESKGTKRRKTLQKKKPETDERMRMLANRRAEEQAQEEAFQRQRAAQDEQSGGGKIAGRMAKIGGAAAGLGFIKILYGAGAAKQAVALTFAFIKIIF